jgi:hypothetical protein
MVYCDEQSASERVLMVIRPFDCGFLSSFLVMSVAEQRADLLRHPPYQGDRVDAPSGE